MSTEGWPGPMLPSPTPDRRAARLCPACLTPLPRRYRYDHVVIDRTLTGRADLWARMDRDERAEVVRTGLARRISYARMAGMFGSSTDYLQGLVRGEDPPLDTQVNRLYFSGYSDSEIADKLQVDRRDVWASRARQELPALIKAGRRRGRAAVPA